jgi:VacB/RNase II family 3'-5' exoribonuclease
MDDLKSIARRAMLNYGLQPDFPAQALAQASAITQTSSDPAVRDLRELLWASIDNDDSQDLDQLSVAEPLAAGTVKILVAIADVDATVKIGTPIDDHARANTTSVYTAAQVFPMLPEKLSTNLTSLADGQERVSLVIEMTIDAAGKLTGSDIYRARVHNRAKLAYNSVAAWLDGKAPMPTRIAAVPGMEQQIRIQDQVAQTLKRVRHEHGALTLETIEARAVFDRGVLSDLRADERNRAKDLIEDFMVAANGVTARFLESKGFPSLSRVLRTPERWNRIVALALETGESLPSKPDAIALNTFLAKRRDTDPAGFADLSLCVVKLLGKGEYALKRPGQDVPGHFGLAVSDYTHSTAPNRRFPDLVTHRLVKTALDGAKIPYALDELDTLARHCTEQQGNADKVERSVRKSAAALLLASRVGQRFDAIVTGASDKGTWVRIPDPVAEGRVVRGFEGLDVGDRVRVELVHTDATRGFIDFARTREGA